MPIDADAGHHPHAQSGGDGFTRLHITPFDAELLSVVVPVSVRPSARNISYHTVQTFPERRYGFVDLPTADADKLKAKLNGSVLKGTKMRIQEATPEVREEPAGFDPEATKKKKKKDKKDRSEEKAEGGSKKRKRDDNVVRGVVLTDRKVQRGWTEAPDYKQKKQKRKEKGDKDKDKGKDKEKRQRTKSKYTEKEECLLKTTLPPSAMKNLSEDATQDKRKKKHKGGDREVTIHEFENTTKFPSFLKTSSTGESRKPASEFVEGQGWVDEDGAVVEAVKVSKPDPKASTKKKAAKPKPAPKPQPVVDSDDETSSSGTSSDGSSSDDDSDSEDEPQKQDVDMAGDSSSGSEKTADEPAPQVTTPRPSSSSNRPTSSGSTMSLKLQIPAVETPAKEVHPLEALYKKKKPEGDATGTPAQQAAEPFSFFGAGGDDNDDEGEDGYENEEAANDGDEASDRSTPMPMTPYSRQDLEQRTVRSAAPTPDTAHPARMRNIWAGLNGKDDEDMDDAPGLDGEEGNDDDDEGADGQASGATKDPGDFQSWFWENRGDLNRSWMKRRKMAAKEKRHRENKARASRAV